MTQITRSSGISVHGNKKHERSFLQSEAVLEGKKKISIPSYKTFQIHHGNNDTEKIYLSKLLIKLLYISALERAFCLF